MKRKWVVIGIISFIVIVSIVVVVYITNNSKQTPYESLRDDGYIGTEQELYDSLLEEEKNLASDSKNAKTAYDEATEKGYKGTKSEWLEVLSGSKIKPTHIATVTLYMIWLFRMDFQVLLKNGLKV